LFLPSLPVETYFPKSGIWEPLDSPWNLKGLEYPEADALSGRTAVVLRARTAGATGLAAARRQRREAVARVAIVRDRGVWRCEVRASKGRFEVFSLVVIG
jgi:hypothetical protein